MGLSAFHTFIRTDDLSAIENALQQIFAFDGFKPLLNPSDQQCKELDATQAFRGVFLHSAVSKDEKWSYIKCVPNELLCQRSQGSSRPRLAEIAQILQVDAFRLEVTDGDSAILLECRHDGEFRVSGASMEMLEEVYSEDDEGWDEIPLFFHEEQIRSDEATFELITDLQPFNPHSYSYPEVAANEIEAEFLGNADDKYLDWIFYDRLYPPTAISPTPDVRELYFYQTN